MVGLSKLLKATAKATKDVVDETPKEKIKVFQGRSKKGTEDFMNPTDFYGDKSISFGTTDLDTADQFAMKQTSTYPYRAKDGSEGPTKKTLIPGDVAELEFDIKNPMVVNRKSIGFSRDNEKAMIAEAKEKGHDGVKIIYDGSDKIDYVAFDKKQVKVVNKSLYPERDYPYSPTGGEKEQMVREKELGLAPPLEIGQSEEALKGTFLRNYTARDAKNMDILSENSTAGSSKADKLINKKVKENEKVAVRLNLNSKLDQKGSNAPSNKLQTVHKNNFNGKALSYKPYATVENAVLNVNQKGRVAIASKIKRLDVPEAKSKFPAMSVDGNYNSTRNVLEEMGDDVVEIGFNPANTHLFIDLKTGQAVKSAEVATVIGDRVYAKGVVYWRKKDAPLNLDASDGTPISSEVRYKFKKGGISMKKQMEMFQEGGLEQDGGTVDPVSGNDVPVGSSQEEVRDDIDAKLSEGEFVFPADVVRYIGLEKLMMLRQEAKAGLKKMEAMGQMGNSEEATLPDDIPFSPEDITVEDDDGNEGELEMNVGGVVYQPSQVGSQFNIAPRQQDPSGTMGYGYVPPVPPVQQTGYSPSFIGQPQTQQQYTGFQDLLPTAQTFDSVEYINNTTGETMTIPHVDGKPIYPPPAGFTVKPKEEIKPEEPKTEEVTVPTTQVAEAKDSDDRNENENRLQSTKSLLGATSTLGVGEGLKGIASNKFGQAGLAYLAGGIPGAILALTGIPQKVANTILGKVNSGEDLTEEEQAQADALANEVALSKREKYFESRPAATNLANQLGLTTVTGRVGLEVGDIDPVTGGIFNQAGQAVDPRTNENLTSYRSFKDAKVSMKAGTKAGWFGGEISNSTYMGLGEEGKKRYGDYVKNMAEEGVNIASEGRQGSGTVDPTAIVTTQDGTIVTKDEGKDKPRTVVKKQDLLKSVTPKGRDPEPERGGGTSFKDIKESTREKGFTGEFGI